MDNALPRTCPLCGGENDQRSTCSFCGTRLADMQETPECPPGETSSAAFPFRPDSPPGTPSRLPLQPPVSFQEIAPSLPPVAPRPAAAEPRFAGFWIRVCAYLVDSVFLWMSLWLLAAVAIIGYTTGASGTVSAEQLAPGYWAQWAPMAGLDVFIKLVYYTLFLGKSGQTLGKKLFGLRVIRTDGGPVTYGQALLRTIGYYLNMLTLQIGFLWVAVDRRKQGLHDKIAGTLEIRVAATRMAGAS